MGELALKKLVFRAGATAGAAPLEIEPGVVTVFVGPNNSGKSRGLAEIATWAQGGVLPGLVIDAADVEFPATVDEAKALLGTYLERAPEPNMLRIATPTVPGSGGGQENVAEVDFSAAIEQDSAALPLHLQNARRRWTLRFFTALWTGRERFGLAGDQPLSDLQQPSQNHLQVLFRDDALRARVRKLIHDAFGMYFVLDPTQPGQLRMRLSKVPPRTPGIERGLDEKAIAFHAETTGLQEQSDGIQCYVGMIVALMSLPMRLILIDEPEAFLHPPLARRLGGSDLGHCP